LDLRIVPPHGDQREFAGHVQLISEVGVSVVSDIDDTIKVSHVAHRRLLLRNTFLRDFQAVDGMAELYRDWAEGGAVFHYVSSSPWQLYGCLSRLLIDEGFPKGSFHLRSVRFRDPSVLRLFVARRRDKRRVIRSIIRSFPRRQFVLVGDSGERDPEVYGSLGREFPGQIQRILIRHVRGRAWTQDRCERAFRGLPLTKVVVFQDANDVRGRITVNSVS
jgi:phosphatidate phosphatase APP1